MLDHARETVGCQAGIGDSEGGTEFAAAARAAARTARDEINRWRDGYAWLGGGTWLFSEPKVKTDTLIDLPSLGWPALRTSLVRVAEVARFSWVLPGHGQWGGADPDTFHAQLVALTDAMAGHDRRSWDRRA